MSDGEEGKKESEEREWTRVFVSREFNCCRPFPAALDSNRERES